ncbi:DUF4105 domain-containing protein [Gayadomonas joobiniege]|uniref:Lnb N-terminal periplasmic domain-containing protein n=1 Tax=Gayadomonas joobiniege TaxID=1234606 RepID=UPI00036AA506|nr:DUF4105 domain-containing protein [Gayadomonas joobiniege]
MNLKYFLPTLLSLYLFINNAAAQGLMLKLTVPTNSNLQQLSQHPTWLRLLHIETGLFTRQGRLSQNDFYLSTQGALDPKQELTATIHQFTQAPKTQCRFPARKLWLTTQLKQLKLPEVTCPNYSDYQQAFKANSVSLVYASGYLGNPASMFGHLLLKLNQNHNTKLLDNTFSYGAIVPASDNKLEYIFNGITGGYQGRFSNQKYHHHQLAYNETELRDMWEYQLNFSPMQIKFLLAHLWELENHSLTYYFFRENCAYQLAKLIELVSNVNLMVDFKPWVMPFDVIKKLTHSSNEHLLGKIIYHPSRQEQLYEKYIQLTASEKRDVTQIINGDKQIIESLIDRDATSSKRIIDTLYDYFAFLEQKNKSLTDNQTSTRHKLLNHRFKLPSGKPDWLSNRPKAPHTAQPSSKVSISQIYNTEYGSANLINFRAGYYDFLTANSARVPWSELIAFDVSLLIHDHNVSLREFIFFSINNLNVTKTGLPEDKAYAWSLSSGYGAKNLACLNCAEFFVSGNVGQSWTLTPGSVFNLSLANKIQFSDLSSFQLSTGPEIEAVLLLTPWWAMSVKTGRAFNISASEDSSNYLIWEQSFSTNENWDIRTAIQYDKAFEYSFSVAKYW